VARSRPAARVGHLDEGAIDSYTFFAIAGDRVALQLTTSPRVAGPRAHGVRPRRRRRGQRARRQCRDHIVHRLGDRVYTVVVYDWSSGFTATGDYELDFTRTPGP